MVWFEGRVGRTKYVLFALGIALVSFGVRWASPGLGRAFGPALIVTYTIIANVLVLSFTTRRWHDMDRTGWLSLLNYIPVVNIVAGLFLLFAPGTKGENRYGVR